MADMNGPLHVQSMAVRNERAVIGALPDLDLTCVARGHLIESVVAIQ